MSMFECKAFILLTLWILMAKLRCLILLFTLLATQANALSFDATQPVEIESDHVSYRTEENTAIYSGNVMLKQGPLMISANSLTIVTEKSKISLVRAEGSPTFFEHQIKDDQTISGRAVSIEYSNKDKRLLLQGSAVLNQKSGSIQADRIFYNIETRHGQAEPMDDKQGGRVKVILRPDTLLHKDR